MSKYSVRQYQVRTLLEWIHIGEIAIPDIQRPFVWKKSQVRDLIDSLYKGYPVGYIIIWTAPSVRTKRGEIVSGKKIIIDGQQRVTALEAALLGKPVRDKNFREYKIAIAFNPKTEVFETSTPAIRRSKEWIPDISVYFTNSSTAKYTILSEYLGNNPDVDKELIAQRLDRLEKIQFSQIGAIELVPNLDVDEVAEIFIRVNSKGTRLNQSDFVMSKLAADKEFGGDFLRRVIDYADHMFQDEEFYAKLPKIDEEFAASDIYPRLKWLYSTPPELYYPDYDDIIRVAFGYGFRRGRLKYLVSLLSGKDLETRKYSVDVKKNTYEKLKNTVNTMLERKHFQRFENILKSAGFIADWLYLSQYTINVAYMVYLLLREMGFSSAATEHFVRKYFVLSILLGRYTGSPETQLEYDLKRLSKNPLEFLKELEKVQLNDEFFGLELPKRFQVSQSGYNHPIYLLYLASLVKKGAYAFLSSNIKVSDIINTEHDLHHIFPKAYLTRFGVPKTKYNLLGNIVIAQREVNLQIKDRSPKEYFEILSEQIEGKTPQIGSITTKDALYRNLEELAIPRDIIHMDYSDYDEFIESRSKLMAKAIKEYYWGL